MWTEQLIMAWKEPIPPGGVRQQQGVTIIPTHAPPPVPHSMHGVVHVNSRPTWGVGHSPPPGPGHERVVEDVKEGDLAVFLPQHKEDLSRTKEG